MSAISVEQVFKIFGNNPEQGLKLLREGVDRDEVNERTGQFGAVVDVTFAVEAGELFVIMGLSGSGKSTLVRMINRLYEPTAGTVKIDGEDIGELDRRGLRALRATRISMVFQTFALFPHRSVLDNTAYGLEVQRIDRNERHERARKALEMVGLSGWEDSSPRQLSGGMRQRVGLARALTTDANILLMDEPFSALDPLIRRDMQSQLIDLQQTLQKTIVFITHDLNEAMLLGDRVAVMKKGSIVQMATPEEILESPADDYVADFIQDVDRSRVVTAGAVMVDPVSTLSPRHGPRVALLQMKEHQVNALYVIDKGRQLVGVVHADDVSAADERDEDTIAGAVRDDYPAAAPDTPIAELFEPAATHALPIAVVDDGTLVGVVPRPVLLAALSTPKERRAHA